MRKTETPKTKLPVRSRILPLVIAAAPLTTTLAFVALASPKLPKWFGE